MSDNMELVSEWVESIREDIETVKKVVECEKLDKDARMFAATALNYLVSRMDLIPDWTDTIGVIDDVLVLRTCVALASAYGVDDGLDAQAMIDVNRLANAAERIESILGEDLDAKLRKHCARISEDAVRGRSPEGIVEDPDVRKKLYEEIDDDLKRMPAASFSDKESVELKLKSYLTAKLASL